MADNKNIGDLLNIADSDPDDKLIIRKGSTDYNILRDDFLNDFVVVTPPATATDAGITNNIAFDGSYMYVCISTNTWVRAPLATW